MGRSSLHIQRKTNQQIQTTRNNMSVSFKVTLSKWEEQETRRFQVDKEVASSLIYLKQKIAAIFPELRRSEPVLCWVDEKKDGKETAEKMDSNTHTSAEDMMGNEKEDKVEAALKTMLAMGFSDDGGWLSSLLRAKSGDVSKVLDAIKPSVIDRY